MTTSGWMTRTLTRCERYAHGLRAYAIRHGDGARWAIYDGRRKVASGTVDGTMGDARAAADLALAGVARRIA